MQKVIRLFLIGLLSLGVAQGELVVVVSEKSVLSKVSSNDLVRLFTGRTKSLDGKRMNPVLLKEGAIHEFFLSDVVNRSSMQLSKSWKKLVFTGKAKMPKVYENEAQLAEAIKKDESLVGYMDRSNVVSGVKVLEVE